MTKRIARRPSLLAFLVLLICAADANATTRLTVFVRNAANQAPLDTAIVCVGTTANRASVGRRSTVNGVAVFESIPDGNWMITAWKTNFARVETNLLVNGQTGTSTTRAFALTNGSATDPCLAPSTVAPSAPTTELKVAATTIAVANTPAITSFSINGGMETMDENDVAYLAVQVTGPVTEYRVSEVSDQFPEPAAAWRPYVRYPAFGGSVRLPNGTSFATKQGTKRVYLQMRSGGRMSNIATDTINMVQSYTASGRDAYEHARSKGYEFKTSPGCDFAPSGSTEFGTALLIRLRAGLVGEHTCALTLFGGPSLAPGWRFTSFKWEITSQEGNCRRSGGPSFPATASPVPFFFQGGYCGFVLRSIELKGPAGGSWRDAFAR